MYINDPSIRKRQGSESGIFPLGRGAPAPAGVAGFAVAVQIAAGAPVAVGLLQQPSPVTKNVGPLPTQPVAALIDAAGNIVPPAAFPVANFTLLAAFGTGGGSKVLAA